MTCQVVLMNAWGSGFTNALSDVWSTMHDVEDGEAR